MFRKIADLSTYLERTFVLLKICGKNLSLALFWTAFSFFYHSKTGQIVRIFKWDLKNKTFNNWPTFHHSKSEHIWFSDLHCNGRAVQWDLNSELVWYSNAPK